MLSQIPMITRMCSVLQIHLIRKVVKRGFWQKLVHVKAKEAEKGTDIKANINIAKGTTDPRVEFILPK